MKTAATNKRNLRTLLLVLEAKEIGERIRQARKEVGFTQDELTQVATFSKRSLQDYEAGVTIPYRQMPELGRLLRREVAWFLHGEPEPAPSPNGLLEEVAENVGVLTDSMAEALLRLARIEGALGTDAERDTGS